MSVSTGQHGTRWKWAAAPLLAALSVVSACSNGSYLVLTLRSDATPFAGITSIAVQVTASDGVTMVTRTYTVNAVTIDASTSKSLSLSFSPERSGLVDINVKAWAGTSCLGTGTAETPLNKSGTARVTVTLIAGCAGELPDAGRPDVLTTFEGCDPAVVGSCPAGQTCYVDCANQMGSCVPGGAKGPGDACTSNNDCAPGTQCFDFNCPTTTRVCLKFCDSDDACSGLSSTTGTSACRDPVLCPAMTSYKTCGFACDPRGAATTGCPAGLYCFLFADPAGGQDSPSCSCPASSRTGTNGTACTASTDCATGFICDQMNGGSVCRRLCEMGSPGDCSGMTTCTALANNTVFGVCI